MKTKLIEKIRSACIKANKEIVELKFGCEVVVSTKKMGAQKTVIKGFLSGGGFMTSFGETPEESIIKIIGRPIHLADVLLAMSKTADTTVEFYANDGITSINCRYNDTPYSIDWNLKETLENQELPTLQFIADLL
ncbi:hypothetical protein LCGC14_1071790 [marine sediment metagenome]|uniref:Uncharacterized protein n=1 Tax=marine sediment metagenome TaxID=412755 RepID=A0A0F9MMZ0_9ZZZZ